MDEKKTKILLVHLYSNGDCLYATAVARQIKNDFPDAVLTWAIAPFCKSIIDGNPFVDNFMEVPDVKKNDNIAFRKYKKKLSGQKKAGIWDKVFITHNMDANLAFYDGTIRGMVLRAYPGKITVPVQPVLYLNETEKNNVLKFVENNGLQNFKNIILWEFAPQSGQIDLNFDFVMQTAKRITLLPNTCVILTSANKFSGNNNIFDASVLSIRENAALTHYCSFFIGCSSGITWLDLSNAAKQLPMLQLLDAHAIFRNLPSDDFKRNNVAADSLIEMFDFDGEKIYDCIKISIESGVTAAKVKYNQNAPLQFFTTRKIIYNLLCYLNFKGIFRHIKIMISIYGYNAELLKQIFLGFVSFPFQLLKNTIIKRFKY